MTAQIWSVELMQKNSRNQVCRQEFLVVAESAEDAEAKGRASADKNRTITEATVQAVGGSYCLHR